MRRLLPVVVVMVFLSAPSAFAQTVVPEPPAPVPTEAPTPPPTDPPPPADEPDIPTQEPAAPVDPADDDDDAGLSPTAIALLIVGGVVILLAIFAMSLGRGRRPGEPGPP